MASKLSLKDLMQVYGSKKDVQKCLTKSAMLTGKNTKEKLEKLHLSRMYVFALAI
jgi:antitoxin component HigA of HigAB toxin-antitoxin module